MANGESERMRLSKLHNVPVDRILISLTELGNMLGLTANPLREMIKAGLPWLEEGRQQAPKKQWAFDSKAVITWMCERARQEGHEQAMKKLGGLPTAGAAAAGTEGYGPKPGEDMIDFRGRVADTHGKEIKTALAAKQVVRVDAVVDVFTAHIADAKNTLQSIKGRVMAYLDKLGVPFVESERVVGNVIDDACDKFSKADPFRSPLEVGEVDDDAPDPEPPADEPGEPEGGDAGDE